MSSLCPVGLDVTETVVSTLLHLVFIFSTFFLCYSAAAFFLSPFQDDH